MDYVPEIITASKARENLYRLIDQTAKEERPIVITGKRKNAVLVSEEYWNSMQETLYLLSIPGMREFLARARKEPLEDATEDPGW